MRIVLVSNFMNHHQKGWCESLIEQGCDFTFIATAGLPEEQRNLGYHDYDLPYIVSYDKTPLEEVEKIILNADAVIFGDRVSDCYERRIASGKLSFIFSERLFKKGRWRVLYYPLRNKLVHKYIPTTNNLPHILCAGAYVAKDYYLIGYPKDRFLRWGYFPEKSYHTFEYLMEKKTSIYLNILWVGRFINWKHPEHAVHAVRYLLNHGVKCSLTMIGIGTMMEQIRELIDKYNLSQYVNLTGAMPPEEVREYMDRAHIVLLTSDYREGWGAALNESMSSGCIVIASRKMGSAPLLVEHGVNGMLYNGTKHDLCKKVLKIASEYNDLNRMSKAAFNTINKLWNSDIAAQRLLEFVKTKSLSNMGGPISKADLL